MSNDFVYLQIKIRNTNVVSKIMEQIVKLAMISKATKIIMVLKIVNLVLHFCTKKATILITLRQNMTSIVNVSNNQYSLIYL